MSNMTGQEEDFRLSMFNSFMSCPHRDTNAIKEVHKEFREKDPVFYSHLACWYLKNGEVRDHQEVFSSMLITDPYLDNRDVGLALFQKHAPFMKSRILGFVKGKNVRIRKKTGEQLKRGKKTFDKYVNEYVEVGLKVPVPTVFKTEVKNYLRWLESDPVRYDSVVMRNAKDLKNLYKRIQLKPSPRAQAILFDKKYPEDSKLNIFKEIQKASPKTAAKLIVENKIPYTVAVGLIDKMTPTILVALINNMSPQEVVNNVAALEEQGAYKNASVKKLIEEKLTLASKSRKVSTLKSQVAKKTGRIKDEDIQKKLDDVSDAQVKKRGAIKDRVGIFVDKSMSMTSAIDVGKRIAAMVGGATLNLPTVMVFDSIARELKTKSNTLSGWEEAFKGVYSGGGTSVGSALALAFRCNILLDTIVIVTDCEELRVPIFAVEYLKYTKNTGLNPRIIIVGVRGYDGRIDERLQMSLDREGIEYEFYTPEGDDYFGLPGLLPLLSQSSKMDLIYSILEYPLLKRKAYK